MDIDSEEKVKLLDDDDAKDVNIDDKCIKKNSTNEHCGPNEFVFVKEHDSENVNKDNGDGDKNGLANGHLINGTIPPSTERRSDEPSELSFEKGNWWLLLLLCLFVFMLRLFIPYMRHCL